MKKNRNNGRHSNSRTTNETEKWNEKKKQNGIENPKLSNIYVWQHQHNRWATEIEAERQRDIKTVEYGKKNGQNLKLYG